METKNEKLVSVKKQRSFISWHEKSPTGYKFSSPRFNSNAISKVMDTLKFDRKPLRKHILDPGSRIVLNWNRVFMVSCLLALFVDPLYFYLPSIVGDDGSWCLKTDYNLRIVVTGFRSIADIFYMLHIVIKFRTAYVSPSSRVFGGQTGFFNSITLKPGDFCGEELLAWALVPKSSANLPASTRTVRALVEVEAFALSAEDLKFVANQFRKLHSKKLQHTFRFYSHHWRTWAACFIQAAWRRYNQRKIGQNLSRIESLASDLMAEAQTEGREQECTPSNVKSNIGWTILASRLAESTRRGVQRIEDVNLPKLPKPEEPDFSAEPDD